MNTSNKRHLISLDAAGEIRLRDADRAGVEVIEGIKIERRCSLSRDAG